MDRLPQEVLDRILDFLTLSDLKSIRLVRRCFRFYGASIIYQSIACSEQISTPSVRSVMEGITLVRLKSLPELASHEYFGRLVRKITLLKPHLEKVMQELMLYLPEFANLVGLRILHWEQSGGLPARTYPILKTFEDISTLPLERLEVLECVVCLRSADLAETDAITSGRRRYLNYLTHASIGFYNPKLKNWSNSGVLQRLEALVKSLRSVHTLSFFGSPMIGQNWHIMSEVLFSTPYAPKLRKFFLHTITLMGPELLDFLRNHQSTLKELSLTEVSISHPNCRWTDIFKTLRNDLTLTKFTMKMSLVERYPGGIKWDIADKTVGEQALSGSIRDGKSCLRGALHDYVLRKGAWPHGFTAALEVKNDAKTLEGVLRLPEENGGGEQSQRLGDTSFFGTEYEE